MRLRRQLRAENLALHYRLLEAQMAASPQSSVVSQSENSSCLDRTSDDSKSYRLQETETSSRYLTIDSEIINALFTAQAQSDLNKLSAEAAVEHSSILVDKCDDLEIACTHCLKKGSLTALRRCTACKSSSYCSKDCQRLDWPSHKQLCKSIQSQNPQN